MGAALTQLIPVQELPPGSVNEIRNRVINSVLDLAAKEMSVSRDDLVVRDIRPADDLVMYTSTGTTNTTNNWRMQGPTSTGYFTVGTGTMGDKRFVALFGVKDIRRHRGLASSSITTVGASYMGGVSLIKINVGGGDRAVWDLSKCESHDEAISGVSPSAVLIPQNTIYTISHYLRLAVQTTDEIILEGVVVEPRGLLISP